jgi:hypothetical protein
LEADELGAVFVHSAAEAGFLNVDIAQLAFVFQVSVGVDHVLTFDGGAVGVFFSELQMAFIKDGGFEALQAVDAPAAIGLRPDQAQFLFVRGLQGFNKSVEFVLVLSRIFAGQQNGCIWF